MAGIKLIRDINTRSHQYGIEITAFKISLRFYILKFPNFEDVLGWTSKCHDGKHIIFMDYDEFPFEEVLDELRDIQKEYDLSDIYIFQMDRENSFHAICLDKFGARPAMKLLGSTNTDRAFQLSPTAFKNREWVLRLGGKGKRGPPEFLCLLKGKGKREKSLAHAQALKEWYDIDIEIDKLFDNYNNGVRYIVYNTASRLNKND